MQNMESVTQKWLSYSLMPLRTPSLEAPDKKSHNLLRQFIQTSMKNLETVAQKTPELGKPSKNKNGQSLESLKFFGN